MVDYSDIYSKIFFHDEDCDFATYKSIPINVPPTHDMIKKLSDAEAKTFCCLEASKRTPRTAYRPVASVSFVVLPAHQLQALRKGRLGDNLSPGNRWFRLLLPTHFAHKESH